MTIFQTKIEVPKDKPFTNCKLEREKYADVLVDIINTYPDGFVLAINNKWGGGKTTFVEMWNQKLCNAGFKTIYFNAWENDFETKPFVAIISEFKKIISDTETDAFKEFILKGAKITMSAIPAFLKTQLKKQLGEGYAEVIEKGADELVGMFKEELGQYEERKKSIVSFKNQLENYIKENSPEKPVIFIVDELDRCRPDFAVDILENIKHLFSVKGIVFVLSIDKEQLGHAVRGYYGSDRIDADEYLRRFFDVEYTIPEPETSLFVNFLFAKYNFDIFLGSDSRMKADVLRREKTMFRDVAEFIFKQFQLTLRQQEKIFQHLRIGLNSFNWNSYVVPEIYVYFTVIKLMAPIEYKQIINQQVTIDELLLINKKLIEAKVEIQEKDRNLAIHIEALLVYLYNEFLGRDSSKAIELEHTVNLNPSILPKSELDLTEKKDAFINRLKNLVNSRFFSDVNIYNIFKRIDLTEPFQIKN